LALDAGAFPLFAKTLCAEAMSATVAIICSSRMTLCLKGLEGFAPDRGQDRNAKIAACGAGGALGAFVLEFGSPGFADWNGEPRDRRIPILNSEHRTGARHAGEVDRVPVGQADAAMRFGLTDVLW
jgi:hypothetical protein